MNSNPFEIIDPFHKEKLKKRSQDTKDNQSSNDLFIEKFMELIKDKDKGTLLEINQLLTNKLKEFK